MLFGEFGTNHRVLRCSLILLPCPNIMLYVGVCASWAHHVNISEFLKGIRPLRQDAGEETLGYAYGHGEFGNLSQFVTGGVAIGGNTINRTLILVAVICVEV